MIKIRIEQPSILEISNNFLTPPTEYGVVLWWSWSGEMSEDRIIRELEEFVSLGIFNVLIGAGYDVNPQYLSAGWFERIRFAIEQARQRNIYVWIADEGTYPSGFAGGKFNSDSPELRMKALVVGERIDVQSGQVISMRLPGDTLGALAVDISTGDSINLDTRSGTLNWIAPEGNWQIWLIKADFRTSPTRYVHHPMKVKDTTYSLCDYLNPEATMTFIKYVHEEYKKYIGHEFGKTVIGFFGDEPDYSIQGIPYTDKILEEFRRRKGYDPKLYIPWFFSRSMPEEARRAKADYWDVWSDLFGDNFFKIQAEWCEKNRLRYVVHLNHEDQMMLLVRSEGDFFKCMRHVHVPAIDAIWRQIWMDKVSDFPKLASSVAHLFGRKRVFTESFAVYGHGLSLEQAKWVIDYQFVRGVNLIMSGFFNGGKRSHPQFIYLPTLIKYVNRVSYLLSLGKPAAQIAVYFPTMSLWLGDEKANKSVWHISKQLLEHQIDFDFVDDYTLASILRLEKGCFRNLSGQAYRAVIVPSSTAISKAALNRLKTFSKSGGRVIFLGKKPNIIVNKSFLEASS
ncbi:MAG: glycosyl hydrolase, partial [Candidatus Bathyarchaeota archaeon]|nr:glycosyl hydrolase [Candidatus Bathyarchaeota archaeon]